MVGKAYSSSEATARLLARMARVIDAIRAKRVAQMAYGDHAALSKLIVTRKPESW